MNEGSLNNFKKYGSEEERAAEQTALSAVFEDKVAKAMSYAAEIAHAEKTDLKHQYMVRQADAVRKLLARVGGFENLTEEACQTIVDDNLFYDKTIVFAIAQTLHKDTSLKH